MAKVEGEAVSSSSEELEDRLTPLSNHERKLIKQTAEDAEPVFP